MGNKRVKSGFSTVEIQWAMREEMSRSAPTQGSFRVKPKDTLQELDRKIDRWAPYAAAFGRWLRD